MTTIESTEQLDIEQPSVEEVRVSLRRDGDTGDERFRPEIPSSLEGAGIQPTVIEQLILKNLYFRGEVSGRDLSKFMGIPFSLIEPSIDHLKRERQIESKRASSIGSISSHFANTEAGRARARESLETNQHLGPVAVPLSQYEAAVQQQKIKPGWMSDSRLRKAFAGAVVSEDFLGQFGPAVNSFKSMLIYGKPGNGKTFLAEQLACIESDAVYIPYYIESEGQIIKVFDPLHHKKVDSAEPSIFLTDDPQYDQRWAKCKRPFLTTGGELTLPMLDLMYVEGAKIYDAPYQFKANNGIYLVDDFGRQQVSPAELLNRWIYPLDRGTDYLSFQTGTKVQVPFECFLVFSSNLNPEDLGDEAFLRRLDYKMFMSNPGSEEFTTILRDFCVQRGLECPEDLLRHTLREHYEKAGRKMRRCHPRDIIRVVIDLISYEKRPYELTRELIDRAYRMKFVSRGYSSE
jgi:hypothetical protein